MIINEYLLGKFLFLIIGIVVGIVYLRYLFKEEAQMTVYLLSATDDDWICLTTPLMFDEKIISSYEDYDDAEFLDSRIRDIVYSKYNQINHN